MKRILFPDGAVLAHPFEIAERAQAYAAENAAELLSVLFERFGVLAPNTEELAVSVERDQRYFSVRSATAVLGDRDDDLFLTEKTTGLADVQVALDDTGNRQPVAPGVRATDRAAALSLRVNAGMAVVSRGPLALTSAVTVSVSKREHLSATTPEKTLYVNLLYAEREDTPVELLPHGSGQSNLRRYGTYRIAIEASQPDPSVGVALARVLLKSSGSVVTDLRSANSARLRVDATLTDETIDPDLVPEIERLLARTGVVDEILNLLQNGRLGTGYVVTEPGIAAPPLFVRTRREPAFRQAMRQRSVAASADKTLWTGRALPDPTWELTVDWNLYGVQVEKLSANSFRIHSGYDLTAIVIDPNLDPLFLRFVGVDYPVASVTSANTVQTVQNVGGATTVDSLGALHNGVDEVYVQAEPERGIKHLSAEKPSQLVVDHSKSESMRARLRLPDGTWRVTLHGASKERRSKHTLTQPLPSLPAPLAVASVTATPYQAEPAYDIVAPKAANPFEKVQIGANGEAAVDTSGVDRFVESVQDELKRIQELEVGLTVAVAFSPRTQFDGVFGGQITAGLRLRVEMLTLKGWKPVSEKEVYRPVDDIVREVAWVDLNTNLYRGAVGTVTALASLDTNLSALPSFVAGDTVKDSEIVRVTADPDAAKNGYYRSESRLSVAPSGSESVARPAGGYWVKVSLTQASFQPAPVTVFFDRLAGGADYRVTVWPVGEMADIGPSTVVTTEKMRSLYNARLGTNLHRTMNDMYQTFSLLMEQVDPARLDAYHDELIGRLHEAVQQASVYGNPPRIEGPFKVNATPPPTVFTGTNLGSVTSVTMRYVPAGKADEQSVVVEADFVINQSAGTTPSILVRNLPEYTDLNPRYPPAVTLVFDARIKGQGIAVVRYETTELQVYGPTAAIFKGLETRKPAGAATIGNTASHYGYFPLHASGSRHVGPLPKVWPSGAQTFLTAHPYLTTNKTDAGETVAPQTALAQCLRFDVNGFLPGLLLDVRVRAVPSESLRRAGDVREVSRLRQGDERALGRRAHVASGGPGLPPDRDQREDRQRVGRGGLRADMGLEELRLGVRLLRRSRRGRQLPRPQPEQPRGES